MEGVRAPPSFALRASEGKRGVRKIVSETRLARLFGACPELVVLRLRSARPKTLRLGLSTIDPEAIEWVEGSLEF